MFDSILYVSVLIYIVITKPIQEGTFIPTLIDLQFWVEKWEDSPCYLFVMFLKLVATSDKFEK